MVDLVAKLRLIAETSGKEGVQALADELEKLATEGGEAAPKLRQMAAELRGAAGTAPALKTLGSAADQAAAALNRIGIRSSDQIQAEINQINQDLIRLGSSAKVSGADFERAFAQAQSRIAGLQSEMSGGVDPFTASVGRATGGIGGLLTRVGPVGAAIAAAFSADHLVRAAVEFDRINRTLEAIAGSGQAAARELGYITKASNRLGLELGASSRAYANLMASAKGTALEGQKGRDVFEAVAGAMSKLGKSSADTEGALLAVGQMVSKGVVSMEELRLQLGDRLPGAMQAAANGAGVTVAELTKMVESGQVLAEDLLPGMAEELKKLYATGGKVEGYVAWWNRFTNAITEAAGQIGQMSIVSGAAEQGLWLMQKAVQALGAVAADVLGGLTMIGSTVVAVGDAILTGNWSQVGPFLSEQALRVAETQEKMRKALNGTEDAANGAGSAAKSAAEKALQGNQGWMAVANTYTQVTASVDGYLKQAEKALEARKAEADAAIAYAQASGNEVQLRQAEAAGAAAVAEATRQLAGAKALQLSVSQAELARKQEVAAADGKESEAKRQLIEKIREKIALQQEEADKARAAASAAQIEAAARQATAEAVRDNSGRMEELRAAYERAAAAVRELEAAETANGAGAARLAAARAEATRASILYRDAVADTVRNIEAQSQAGQTALGVEERLAQLKIAQARTSAQIARSLGNEQAAVWAVVEAKRQEANIASIRSRQQMLEAQSSWELAKAKLSEALRSGQATEAKFREFEAAENIKKAKEAEAQGSLELAKMLNAEADAAIRATNAKRDSADAGQQMADGALQADQGIQRLVGTAESVGGRLGKIWQAAVDAIREISPAAADAVGKIQAGSDSFHEFSMGVLGLGQSAKELVAGGPLGELTAKLEKIRAETAGVTTALEGLNNINSQMAAGLGFAGFWKGVAAMTELRRSLLEAKEAQVEFSVEVQKFNDRVDDGNLALGDQESILAGLVSRAEELGSQELSGLRSALDSVRSQLRSIDESARSTLDSISDELDQINGRYEAIEQRRAAARRAEIETQLKTARAAGDNTAAADLQRALSQLSELERVRLAEARTREQEDRARQTAARTPTQPAASAAPAPSAAPAAVVRVEIKGPDGRTTAINTSSQRDADALASVLKSLESAMARAS